MIFYHLDQFTIAHVNIMRHATQIWDPTVYPKKYAHGFCFAVLCCGYTLTDFPISIRLTSLALWQSNHCPSASKATLMNMDKYFMCIHYGRLHNHNKTKHNKTVCIFLGIYCKSRPQFQLLWSMSPRTFNEISHANSTKSKNMGFFTSWIVFLKSHFFLKCAIWTVICYMPCSPNILKWGTRTWDLADHRSGCTLKIYDLSRKSKQSDTNDTTQA